MNKFRKGDLLEAECTNKVITKGNTYLLRSQSLQGTGLVQDCATCANIKVRLDWFTYVDPGTNVYWQGWAKEHPKRASQYYPRAKLCRGHY